MEKFFAMLNHIALITHSDSLVDFETYRIYPKHQKVIARFADFSLDRQRWILNFEGIGKAKAEAKRKR